MTTALRVQIEGVVTSFRHPHFSLGMQPSYDLPPPATIYGHVSSALGYNPAPDSFRFALRFETQARFWDYEHTHLFGSEPKLSPLERELLFQPRLWLYLDRPDWIDAFRRPAFVVTLGRSQDLMCYRAVHTIDLVLAERGYVTATYMPVAMARALRHRATVTMPQFVDAERHPHWRQYALIRQPQVWPQTADCDPLAPLWNGLPQAVIWNRFVDTDHPI